MDLIIFLWSGVVFDDRIGALLFDFQGTKRNAYVAHLAPILPPAVTDMPIAPVSRVRTPAHDGDDMVDTRTLVFGDASLKVQQRHCIDSTSNGAICEDLFLHCGLSR